ncbi:mitochondrial import receptor subunit TOM7 homolog [Diorhabda sublineata]|uniref:mitochondrial import receptor subunit TOM7 homolog n=1 Tax=Diorhabda sublineata TaxID=1163346 RepID=UPI0024E12612|nr:mitochondrial import receptor subunit TOM7 homolog [Diorhabda sublineata]
MVFSEDSKQRLSTVIDLAKTVFHYGFIPTVLYLGFKKGADPGMPEISVTNIFW